MNGNRFMGREAWRSNTLRLAEVLTSNYFYARDALTLSPVRLPIGFSWKQCPPMPNQSDWQAVRDSLGAIPIESMSTKIACPVCRAEGLCGTEICPHCEGNGYLDLPYRTPE